MSIINYLERRYTPQHTVERARRTALLPALLPNSEPPWEHRCYRVEVDIDAAAPIAPGVQVVPLHGEAMPLVRLSKAICELALTRAGSLTPSLRWPAGVDSLPNIGG